jgi:hypothetical protein
MVSVTGGWRRHEVDLGAPANEGRERDVKSPRGEQPWR